MLIELWRKEVATSYSSTCCAICGNDFELGSVYPMVSSDSGHDLGEMCPVCLDYLNRRKGAPEDPRTTNWPSRDWPTVEDLEEARRRYPFPMFETEDDLVAAAVDEEADWKLVQDCRVWRMERERV